MKSISRVGAFVVVAALCGVVGARPAPPPGTWSLFSVPSIAGIPSVVQISSRPARYAFDLISSDEDGIAGSGMQFDPNGVLTFSQLTKLSTDFVVPVGGIGGGSPRFAVGIDLNGDGVFEQAADGSGPDGNVFVFIGSSETGFLDAPSTVWANTGNLMRATDNRFGCSQVGGDVFDSYATALSLVGNKRVMYVLFCIDSSGGFGEAEVLVNNVTVNNSVLTATKK